MDKKIIKNHLAKFVSESATPGITVTNGVKKSNAKVNKDGVKAIEKDVNSYEKGLKKKDMKEIPPKFNYSDDFEKKYHEEMEILNGQEMIQYDRTPDEKFVQRAMEAIEGSAKMGNQGGIGNAQATWGASSDDFGKNLVKRIKDSAKKRGQETPAISLRGKDIQELPTKMVDNGHRPIAIEENIQHTSPNGAIMDDPAMEDKYYSSCCGAESDGHAVDYGICPECKDHCGFTDSDGEEIDTFKRSKPNKVTEMATPAKPISDKNKMVLTNWVEKMGAKGAAERMINSLSESGMISDLPDTLEYGQGLNKITALLEKKDFDNAYAKAKALATKLEKKAMKDMGMYENKNNNNKPKIKESMKKLTFKKEFNGVGNALKLIPEGYRVNKKEFVMTDGNETYKIRWEGNLSEGKAIVLNAADKTMVNEDIKRMKELFGYKSQDTLGLVKGNARVDENQIFGDIWNKSKILLGESEDIESSNAKEGNWEDQTKKAPEAKKHVEGSTSTDKGTKAPKAKEGNWENSTKKAPEATKDINGSGTNGKIGGKPKEGHWEDVKGGAAAPKTQAPKPSEGNWEDINMGQASEATEHMEGSTSTDKGTVAPKPKQGHWEDNVIGQAPEAKKHIHLKESEMEEEETLEEEETEEEMVDENEMDNFKPMTEEEGEEEMDDDSEEEMDDDSEEETDNFYKPDADDSSNDEHEPTPRELKKTAVPPMGDDDEDEAVPLAGGATTDAKLFRSPSTNSYWLQVGGEMKEVPEELLSIASNTSIPSKARAAKIMSKMEAMKTSPEMEPEF